MLAQPPQGQDVEWGYAFDVHLNALFPLLMVLHFFQLPLLQGEASLFVLTFLQIDKVPGSRTIYTKNDGNIG